MTFKIYDSASRSLRTFTPLEAGKAGIYLCGATVQGSPHIGHIRSALAFDVLVRWLRRQEYSVTLIRNVTDIDDKILAKASAAGAPWWAWGYKYEKEFTAAYNALGVLPPTYEPRATGHIPEMIALTQRIMHNGHAYAGNAGNVYFDVASLADYGSLTRQSLAELHVDTSDIEEDKRSPYDFALWKAPKPGEPASAAWETPWGAARPGWHLECTAMSEKYLGKSFDIHGGGIDLRFPHHENEQAQAHGAGCGFARYWMHNAWVTIKGEKMSKSLGNSLLVESILQEYPAALVRLALGTVHYRSTVAYSEETLLEAAAVWERLSGFVKRAAEMSGEIARAEIAELPAAQLPVDFQAAMNDDLNVAGALAVIHEVVKVGNNALAAGKVAEVQKCQLEVRAMLDVLGLDPLAAPWREEDTASSRYQEALDVLVQRLLAQRAAARAEKNWAVADSLRDTLLAAGITVEDSAQGAHWKISGK